MSESIKDVHFGRRLTNMSESIKDVHFGRRLYLMFMYEKGRNSQKRNQNQRSRHLPI